MLWDGCGASWRVWGVVVAVGATLMSPLASAQPLAEEPAVSEAAAQAAAAEQAGELERALKLYELAWRESGDALMLYKRVLIYERLGQASFALALVEEHREALAAHPGISDLTLVEQRLRDAQHQTPGAGGGERSPGGLTWGLIGGGAALVVGAGVALWLADQAASERACSANSSGDKQGCARVEPWTQERFEQSQSSQRLRASLGVASLGVGTGLLAWGIVRLWASPAATEQASGRASGQGRAAQAAQWTLTPEPGGGQVQVFWRF